MSVARRHASRTSSPTPPTPGSVLSAAVDAWCCCWWPSSPATPGGSRARPTASTRWPSTASGRLADANALLFSPAPGHPDPAGLARPRRRARHHDRPAPGPVRLRLRPSSSPSTTPTATGRSCAGRAAGCPAKLTRRTSRRPLRRAIAGETVIVSVPSLADARAVPGLSPKASSGLYAVLPARGSVIGLLAVEHPAERHFTDRDVELLKGFVEPVALAIDNARWFARLRTVGADEERTRIARDLHDRIGQSLAYLAFELDRIVANARPGARTSARSLEQLRDDVRGVIREVRDTLYDLRTDVSDSQDMAATLEAYVARVQDRSGLDDRAVLRPRRPPADPAGAGDVAHRPGGAHQRRAPRRRHPGPGAVALQRRVGGARGHRQRPGLPDRHRPAASTPTASSACASGPRASGPPSSVTSQVGKGTRVRCSLIRSGRPTPEPPAVEPRPRAVRPRTPGPAGRRPTDPRPARRRWGTGDASA